MTHSKANKDSHAYYKQFFGKEPGERHEVYTFAYGHTSPDNLPGIIDNSER